MQAAEWLALYDQQERMQAEFPTAERVETAHTLRFVSGPPDHSFVLYSQLRGLPDEAINAVIENEKQYFTGRGLPFEWKVYSHDAPPDLRERLVMQGFEAEKPETLLMLDLNDAPPALFEPGSHEISRLTQPEQVADIEAVEVAVWGADEQGMASRLRADLISSPDYISLYVARVGGQPVGAAWITFVRGSEFGGLWGGSVINGYRSRGIYRALLAARAQEARERGRRFLMIDASEMSRPIVERLGFQAVAITTPCIYTPF